MTREFCRRIAQKSKKRDAVRIRSSDLLSAVQFAYRKHHLGDDSIGWNELSDILLNALCNAMGEKGYRKWLKSVHR